MSDFAEEADFLVRYRALLREKKAAAEKQALPGGAAIGTGISRMLGNDGLLGAIKGMDPRLRWGLGGALGGGALGFALDRTKDEEDRDPLNSVLSGMAAGGATGLGAGLIANPPELKAIQDWFSKKKSPAPTQVPTEGGTANALGGVGSAVADGSPGARPKAAPMVAGGGAGAVAHSPGQGQAMASLTPEQLHAVSAQLRNEEQRPGAVRNAEIATRAAARTGAGPLGLAAATGVTGLGMGDALANRLLSHGEVERGARKVNSGILGDGKVDATPEVKGLASMIDVGRRPAFAAEAGNQVPEATATSLGGSAKDRARDFTRLLGRENVVTETLRGGGRYLGPGRTEPSVDIRNNDIYHNPTVSSYFREQARQNGGMIPVESARTGPSLNSTVRGLEELRQQGVTGASRWGRRGMRWGTAGLGAGLPLLEAYGRNREQVANELDTELQMPLNRMNINILR